MGDAYTPGLTVTGSTVVRKVRRLPLPGKVLAQVGQTVAASDVVARTELPGRVHLQNFANILGVLPDELAATLRVTPGASIRAGQLLAEHRAFFGLLRSRAEAPTDGTFESVSEVTGQAVMREPPRPVDVTAYLEGTVVEEIPAEGVIIEARAAMVQGIFGLSGEVHAPLLMAVSDRGATLDADDLDESCAGKVVVGGGRATLAALSRARELGVAAIVVGGFAYQDIKEVLGYDVGVAITGTEDLETTLVVTEGFGDIAMARATFELFGRHEGMAASVNGSTQIRAGVIRPEVVIPLDGPGRADAPHRTADAEGEGQGVPGEDGAGGLEIGAPVRCIRAPYFGRIGTVVAMPVELQVMPSESKVRVCEVKLEGAERVVVPRANVEVIER
jgi:hypothetical protein